MEHITIYKEAQIEKVRLAAQAAAQVLARLCDAVQPGMTTLDLDNLAECFIRETGGRSGSLNYCGYPRQVCISLNDEVVHGIGRADRIIQFGDLVSIDVVVELGGYYGDNARTVCAGGDPDPLSARLLETTERHSREIRSTMSAPPSKGSSNPPDSAASGTWWAMDADSTCTNPRKSPTSR